MDRATYDALVASVEKWRKNATSHSHYVKTGPEDCALCKLFIGHGCRGCPVSQVTGKIQCADTPYIKALYDKWFASDLDGKYYQSRWQESAQREADFLAALVPAGGPEE